MHARARSSGQRGMAPAIWGVGRWAALFAICCVVGCTTARPAPRPLRELVEEAQAISRRDDRAPAQTGWSSDFGRAAAPRHPAILEPIEVANAPVQYVSDERSWAGPDFAPPLHAIPPAPAREGPLLNETFVENDLREALQILALQAKVSIVIDDQVRGVTSAVIEDEPFEAALEKVLSPLGYVYRRAGDEYLVGVADPASALFPRIAERFDYYTRHLPPSELMPLLPEHLKLFVHTSEKRNLIIVEAPAQIAASILESLSRSDQPVRQVVLEAFVCVISPESGLQFGLEVEQGLPLTGNSALMLAMSGLNLTGKYGTAGLSDFAFTSALLKALAREGYVSIRAAPRVMAKDGETAKISIAKETFFSVQPNANQILFRQDIEKIEAGISLDITPVIRGDHITVHIDRAEVSEGLDNPSQLDEMNTFPIINRRRVSTTVHVRDGETITIGGLVQRQQVERLSQVPILGGIPGIGRAFQRIDRREEEAEVVIFISPRIVREGIP